MGEDWRWNRLGLDSDGASVFDGLIEIPRFQTMKM
jgi:hypothetical protein